MKTTLLALVFMGCCYFSNAQTGTGGVINSTGGTFENNNITYEWSVGELCLINAMQSADGQCTLTHGYLQPLSDIKKGGNTPLPIGEDEIHILQNPTTDKITIHFRLPVEGNIQLTMYSDVGKLVHQSNFSYLGNEAYNTISMKHLKDGVYVLNIKLVPAKQGNIKKSNSYKIIKIS